MFLPVAEISDTALHALPSLKKGAFYIYYSTGFPASAGPGYRAPFVSGRRWLWRVPYERKKERFDSLSAEDRPL